MAQHNKVLLVGGNKGLGEAIRNNLACYGYEVEAKSKSKGLDLEWSAQKIKAAVIDSLEKLGGLNTLIISSGIGAYFSPVVDDEAVKRMFQINVFGPMTIFRTCQKALLRSGGKCLVVSSTAARKPGSGGLSVYAASKGALNSWVMSEGRRQIKHGIALCAVSPGWFESPMTQDIVPEVKEATLKGIPAGRYGTVEEVAKFTCSLIEQSNWCLAGQIYEVSGGA